MAAPGPSSRAVATISFRGCRKECAGPARMPCARYGRRKSAPFNPRASCSLFKYLKLLIKYIKLQPHEFPALRNSPSKFCIILGRPTVLTGLFWSAVMVEIAKSPSSFSGGAMSRLSLAAKLYAIFALFAVLTAAITALSDYNSRQNAALTEAVATASRAALNGERVNSLVYAVVMESRGVYMSTEPAVVKKYGEGLLKFNERILDVVKNWEALVQADDAEQFAAFKKRVQQFVEFRAELVRRGVEINSAAGR